MPSNYVNCPNCGSRGIRESERSKKAECPDCDFSESLIRPVRNDYDAAQNVAAGHGIHPDDLRAYVATMAGLIALLFKVVIEVPKALARVAARLYSRNRDQSRSFSTTSFHADRFEMKAQADYQSQRDKAQAEFEAYEAKAQAEFEASEAKARAEFEASLAKLHRESKKRLELLELATKEFPSSTDQQEKKQIRKRTE